MKPTFASSLLFLAFFGSPQVTRADTLTFSYTRLDASFPGTTVTDAADINNRGQIVGDYGGTEGQRGYSLVNGIFTTIDVPGSTRTLASGINDAGQIVGEYDFSSEGSGPHGFIDRNGMFEIINVPGSVFTHANGLNDAGQIVGSYGPAVPPNQFPPSRGFLYSNGVFTTIDVPGSTDTSVDGINNTGQMVGRYIDSSGGTHGFVYANSTFMILDVPGSLATEANGINDAGEIVGLVAFAGGPLGSSIFRGFVDSNGTFTIIDIPFATGLNTDDADGVNNAGQVVGNYFDLTGSHGFLATPVPEPMPVLLCAAGFTGVAFWSRLRTRLRSRKLERAD